MREINILRNIDHPNVIKLLEVATSRELEANKGQTFLVFEYCEHDLHGLIKQNISFNNFHVKMMMFQLISGLVEIHSKNIIHRDIKCIYIYILVFDVRIYIYIYIHTYIGVLFCVVLWIVALIGFIKKDL